MKRVEVRNEERREKWLSLEEKVGGENGREIVAALKELYDVYSPKAINWLGNLYDPALGGFYYSESAQRTEGYLPDIESTIEALAIIEASGMSGGANWYDVIPDWLKKRVGEFTLSLQHPDGYFYHPQWGSEISNLRKSRDLGTGRRLLRFTGFEPKYPVPSAPTKDGCFDMSNAPERFKSLENYLAYLDKLDIPHRSYNAGSEMNSQFGEVRAYGELLGVVLVEITMKRFDEYQREDNGLWNEEINYYGANGLHKISWIYNWTNRPIRYYEKAIESAMKVIMSDVPAGGSVDVYNPWHAIGEVLINCENHCTPEKYAELRDRVYAFAPAAIRKSAEKISVFNKPDGGMSYLRDYSCPTSQRAPAAVPNSVESDVNGFACASTSLVTSIYRSLGLSEYMVPLYTASDLGLFLSILEKREKEYQENKK